MDRSEYKVVFASSAAKEFCALPIDTKRRIEETVDKLKQDPRPRNSRKLIGHHNTYRVRVGHFRVVYEIQEDPRSVRVTRVRHRRDVYR